MVFFFYLFAAIAVGMVMLVIFKTNPVASALSLVFGLFAISGLYVLLDAPFVAVLQVLVYAGAIMVLFVFVIMLLKLKPEDLEQDRVTPGKAGVAILGVLFVSLLVAEILKMPKGVFKSVSPQFGSPQEVGQILFSDFLIPFELASILLLVAMIGVLILGRKRLP